MFRPVIALAAAAALTACSPSSYNLETALQLDSASPGLKYRDRDPVPIKGKQPKEFDVHGIDISRYQPAIDWKTAKRAGVAFAFIKATEGKDDRDPKFQQWWQQAAAGGVPRSAYHFYYFCAPATAQARNYIRAVPRSDTSLPPVLDVEWNSASKTCRTRPAPQRVRAELKTWLNIVEKHYGQKPIIYTTVDFYADNLEGGHLPGYQYWLRSVTAEPKYKYGRRPWVFWQYTGTGSIPGIAGPVDINVFNGSRSAWERWVRRNKRG